MESTDRGHLEDMASKLVELGFHARLMMDGDTPLLFALGIGKTHSVDFRRREGRLVLEFWRGYPDDDFIGSQTVGTFREALEAIPPWLSRDERIC